MSASLNWMKGCFQSRTDVCLELGGPLEANAAGPGGSCALDVDHLL